MEGQNWNGSSLAYGQDVLPVKYKQNVDKRFRVMTAVAGSYKLASGTESRKQGEWYTAVPPLLRYTLGISPVDYFGRTLVAGIADTNIKIGIIAVAVAGAAIEGLEKVSGTTNTYYNSQQDFMKQIATMYDNNPYNRLITLAKEAQKVGVIKGIIMHQGESGAASGNWAQKVKGIYDNLLSDLGLPANSIPFLAGEPVVTDANPNQNNATLIRGLTNTMTAKLPSGANVAHVISSKGCTSGGDNLHFSYDGYEKLGTRYGEKMLELLYGK
ncbi:acetyl xylan esterase [Fibrobacteria bacterium R8-3-H12]